MRKWKWMAGMRYMRPQYLLHQRVTEWMAANGYGLPDDCVPDWEDPATVGCLLAQVREARGEPTYRPYSLMDGPEVFWIVEAPSKDRQTRYATEAEALLAALEGAKSDDEAAS